VGEGLFEGRGVMLKPLNCPKKLLLRLKVVPSVLAEDKGLTVGPRLLLPLGLGRRDTWALSDPVDPSVGSGLEISSPRTPLAMLLEPRNAMELPRLICRVGGSGFFSAGLVLTEKQNTL
jgi:hypothetical protein